MGIFNKTEEEIKKEEENKKYRAIQDEIDDAFTFENINYEVKMVLRTYIEDIKNGKPNDFGDIPTLYKVIKKLIKNNSLNTEQINMHLDAIKELYNKLIRRDNKEDLIDLFIDLFVGPFGIVYMFDEGFYALFKDKSDYFEIMQMILKSKKAFDNYNRIYAYAKSVGKYALNQDILKRDIIAYIQGLDDVINNEYDKYDLEQLENARRRIGVYNISPKDLANADYQLRRIESYTEQFDIFRANLDEEKEAVTNLIQTGKKEIKESTTDAINILKNMIAQEKSSLLQKLDAYLLDLEATLKANSDAVFREILDSYQKQVEEFRSMFVGYSTSVSKDFVEIQKATEESIKKLQTYVSNEPQLQKLLKKAEEQNVVRKKIVELATKEEELRELAKEAKFETKAVKTEPEELVVIPGYEKRVMVPYSRMVLPEKVSRDINYLFDENIPFDKRLRALEKRIQYKERQGEIFHKRVPQIAIDLMEGDWPYLWGPSGTGKSYMVKQVASLIGIPLTKSGKITEPYSVLGYNDPQGRYQITPSFIAALYGHLLFQDELDNGNPDTQVVLNDIYSELLNKLENPNEVCEITFGTDVRVDVNPNFRMVAAGNTSGEGENETFSSRGKMDESLQERMTPIYIDYDDRVEKKILEKYPEWYDFFIKFRKACLKYTNRVGLESAQGIATTRDAAALKKYIEHNSKTIDQIIEEKFIQIKDAEYRFALGRTIADMYLLDYEKCQNPNYQGSLSDAKGIILARKFISNCKSRVE